MYDRAASWSGRGFAARQHIDQLLDDARPVESGAPLRHAHLAPAADRLAPEEEVGRAAPLVLVVDPLSMTGADRYRLPLLGEQLLADLVQADLRALRVVRPGVDRQHVLHPPHELAPLCFGGMHHRSVSQGLSSFFFRSRRTVS